VSDHDDRSLIGANLGFDNRGPCWPENKSRRQCLNPGGGFFVPGAPPAFWYDEIWFTISTPSAVEIVSVRHGVSEIDGRQVRVTLHVKDVKPNAQIPGSIDIAYDVVAEVMPIPTVPILEVHETVQ
jgi:hypothetical protein